MPNRIVIHNNDEATIYEEDREMRVSTAYVEIWARGGGMDYEMQDNRIRYGTSVTEDMRASQLEIDRLARETLQNASMYGIPTGTASSIQAREAPPLTERSLREAAEATRRGALNTGRPVPRGSLDSIYNDWERGGRDRSPPTHTTQVYNVPNDPLDQRLFYVNMGFRYLFDMLKDFKGKIKFDTKTKQFVKIEEK
jgi:hypothetical protein